MVIRHSARLAARSLLLVIQRIYGNNPCLWKSTSTARGSQELYAQLAAPLHSMSRIGLQLQAASPACGKITTVTLGARGFILRAPLEPCRPSGAPLPLMVLIHCFGCDAAAEIQKYSEAADAHGFVLAAPEGYQNSWNAPHCCGPARVEGYDDVGFIDAVVNHSGRLLPIAPDAIFAAGFSNGGFMSSHLAWTGATRWAGISPASGHEYSVNADRPMPVYMHHCGADIMVKMAGCCVENSVPTCCCGIGSQRKTCVATASLFEQVALAPTNAQYKDPLAHSHASPRPSLSHPFSPSPLTTHHSPLTTHHSPPSTPPSPSP